MSTFVEKELYKLAENLPSRIKNTNDMLNIIDNLNNNCILENAFLISFDVVNMFPSIRNESGIKSVERLLNNTRSILNPPTYKQITNYKQMGRHRTLIYFALITILL